MFGWLKGSEPIILIVLGLLLFGRKLPGIARSLGQSVVEFKKGIKGVQDEGTIPVNNSPTVAHVPQPQPRQVIDVSATSAPAKQEDPHAKIVEAQRMIDEAKQHLATQGAQTPQKV